MIGRVAAVRWIAPAIIACATIGAAAPAPKAGISFFQEGRAIAGERVRFRFDHGHGWRPGAVRRSGNHDRPLYDYPLTPTGAVRAEALLIRRGQRIARASIVVPVEPDRRYLVIAAVQGDDPTRLCMGCSEVASAPIAGERGPRARRLWLYYSFNGISHPILF